MKQKPFNYSQITQRNVSSFVCLKKFCRGEMRWEKQLNFPFKLIQVSFASLEDVKIAQSMIISRVIDDVSRMVALSCESSIRLCEAYRLFIKSFFLFYFIFFSAWCVSTFPLEKCNFSTYLFALCVSTRIKIRQDSSLLQSQIPIIEYNLTSTIINSSFRVSSKIVFRKYLQSNWISFLNITDLCSRKLRILIDLIFFHYLKLTFRHETSLRWYFSLFLFLIW